MTNCKKLDKILAEKQENDYNNFIKWENEADDLLKKLYNEYKNNSFKTMSVNALMRRMYQLGYASNEKYDWDILDVHNSIYKRLYPALNDVIKNTSIENQLGKIKFWEYNCNNKKCDYYKGNGACQLEWISDNCLQVEKINKDGFVGTKVNKES